MFFVEKIQDRDGDTARGGRKTVSRVRRQSISEVVMRHEQHKDAVILCRKLQASSLRLGKYLKDADIPFEIERFAGRGPESLGGECRRRVMVLDADVEIPESVLGRAVLVGIQERDCTRPAPEFSAEMMSVVLVGKPSCCRVTSPDTYRSAPSVFKPGILPIELRRLICREARRPVVDPSVLERAGDMAVVRRPRPDGSLLVRGGLLTARGG